jgi:hypothetical protein
MLNLPKVLTTLSNSSSNLQESQIYDAAIVSKYRFHLHIPDGRCPGHRRGVSVHKNACKQTKTWITHQ